MSESTDTKQEATRFSVSLDAETRQKLEERRERILKELGMEVSLSEAAASLIRTGLRK